MVFAGGGGAADGIHRLLQPGRRAFASKCEADAAQARADGDEEWATQLEQIARDSFPDQRPVDNVFNYKILSEDEERQWNELFNEVVNG